MELPFVHLYRFEKRTLSIEDRTDSVQISKTTLTYILIEILVDATIYFYDSLFYVLFLNEIGVKRTFLVYMINTLVSVQNIFNR